LTQQLVDGLLYDENSEARLFRLAASEADVMTAMPGVRERINEVLGTKLENPNEISRQPADLHIKGHQYP
jgi:hypothetical protein